MWMGLLPSAHTGPMHSIGPILNFLSNLAQHAAQALHNTHQHEEVERQSKLDSLTGVYNHGNFLKLLKEQADQASVERQPLGAYYA